MGVGVRGGYLMSIAPLHHAALCLSGLSKQSSVGKAQTTRKQNHKDYNHKKGLQVYERDRENERRRKCVCVCVLRIRMLCVCTLVCFYVRLLHKR